MQNQGFNRVDAGHIAAAIVAAAPALLGREERLTAGFHEKRKTLHQNSNGGRQWGCSGVVLFEQDCGSEYVEMCKGANLGLGRSGIVLYCGTESLAIEPVFIRTSDSVQKAPN